MMLRAFFRIFEKSEFLKVFFEDFLPQKKKKILEIRYGVQWGKSKAFRKLFWGFSLGIQTVFFIF